MTRARVGWIVTNEATKTKKKDSACVDREVVASGQLPLYFSRQQTEATVSVESVCKGGSSGIHTANE